LTGLSTSASMLNAIPRLVVRVRLKKPGMTCRSTCGTSSRTAASLEMMSASRKPTVAMHQTDFFIGYKTAAGLGPAAEGNR